jgi:hypothetical protein
MPAGLAIHATMGLRGLLISRWGASGVLAACAAVLLADGLCSACAMGETAIR